jgi:DNA (cytosine-5)-methyltransferase 1
MPAEEPLRTICAETKGGHMALVSAFLAKHYGGHETPGVSCEDSMSTVTAKDHHAVVAATLMRQFGTATAADIQAPLGTIMADGAGGKTGLIQAFLLKYYGSDQDPHLESPMHTVTARDRFGLVTVAGEKYQITDIGMRMLQPRELYRAQGFPESYIIGDTPEQGLTLTKSAQVRMCGNSVCPPMAAALVRANVPELAAWSRDEMKHQPALLA